jgi:holo-[acyl-carrier protein] synthase
MIFGIGTDVCEIERVAGVYQRYGEHFVQRLLLPEECLAFERHRPRPERATRFLAQRFAAKEAIAKALGTGFAHGLWIRDCGVVQNVWGRPEVAWSTRGQALARRLGAGAGHVTLTDEAGLVVAVAVLEKLPA